MAEFVYNLAIYSHQSFGAASVWNQTIYDDVTFGRSDYKAQIRTRQTFCIIVLQVTLTFDNLEGTHS